MPGRDQALGVQIQYRFNERLLAVSRTQRPVAFTDVANLSGPGNRPGAIPASAAATPVRHCTTMHRLKQSIGMSFTEPAVDRWFQS